MSRPNRLQAVMAIRRFGFRGVGFCVRASGSRGMAKLRLPGSLTPVLVRRGTSDWDTFDQVFLKHEYSDDFLNLFGYEFDSGEPKLIVDAGANVGYASIWFARRFPNARILAVEPDAANFELLVRNTSDYPNVEPVKAALWATSIPLEIVDDTVDSNAFQVRPVELGGPSIEGRTVLDLLGSVDEDRIDILKIDIEGAELELFDAAPNQWLPLVDVMFVELHDWIRPGCSRAFYRALHNVDFAQYPVGENIGMILHTASSTAGPAAT